MEEVKGMLLPTASGLQEAPILEPWERTLKITSTSGDPVLKKLTKIAFFLFEESMDRLQWI